MNDDLISRSALKKALRSYDKFGYTANRELIRLDDSNRDKYVSYTKFDDVCNCIDNAPTVEKPQSEWIPVSERLPDNETEVLIQFGYSQSMMVGYHILDLTIYPLEFKDQNETGWYDSNDDFIGGTYEAVAWMPLPELYKEEENEK